MKKRRVSDKEIQQIVDLHFRAEHILQTACEEIMLEFEKYLGWDVENPKKGP